MRVLIFVIGCLAGALAVGVCWTWVGLRSGHPLGPELEGLRMRRSPGEIEFQYSQDISSFLIPWPQEGAAGDTVSFYGPPPLLAASERGRLTTTYEIYFGMEHPEVIYNVYEAMTVPYAWRDVLLNGRDEVTGYYGLGPGGSGLQELTSPCSLGVRAKVLRIERNVILPAGYPKMTAQEKTSGYDRVDVAVPDGAKSGWVVFLIRRSELTGAPVLESNIILSYFRVREHTQGR